MKKIVWLVLTTFILCVLISCSHRTVEVEKPVMVNRIVERTDTLRENIYLADSVYVREKGDTVYIYKQKTAYIDKWHYSTRTDTIEKPVYITRTEIKEVERELRWWQRMLMGFGAVAILGLSISIFSLIKRK